MNIHSIFWRVTGDYLYNGFITAPVTKKKIEK